jgi:hypothetical protein
MAHLTALACVSNNDIKGEAMPTVKNTWNDDKNFIVELSVAGFGVVYAFPIAELANGASLSRMMNLKVRATLASGGWTIDPKLLKEAAALGMVSLRKLIEHYFSIHGSPNSP